VFINGGNAQLTEKKPTKKEKEKKKKSSGPGKEDK